MQFISVTFSDFFRTILITNYLLTRNIIFDSNLDIFKSKYKVCCGNSLQNMTQVFKNVFYKWKQREVWNTSNLRWSILPTTACSEKMKLTFAFSSACHWFWSLRFRILCCSLRDSILLMFRAFLSDSVLSSRPCWIGGGWKKRRNHDTQNMNNQAGKGIKIHKTWQLVQEAGR